MLSIIVIINYIITSILIHIYIYIGKGGPHKRNIVSFANVVNVRRHGGVCADSVALKKPQQIRLRQIWGRGSQSLLKSPFIYILCYITLSYIMLYYIIIILYCIIIILYYIILCYIILHYIIYRGQQRGAAKRSKAQQSAANSRKAQQSTARRSKPQQGAAKRIKAQKSAARSREKQQLADHDRDALEWDFVSGAEGREPGVSDFRLSQDSGKAGVEANFGAGSEGLAVDLEANRGLLEPAVSSH